MRKLIGEFERVGKVIVSPSEEEGEVRLKVIS